MNGDHILLMQRRYPPFLDKWDSPGGAVEYGETPEQAARREVLEETGLTITDCHHRASLLLYNTDDETGIAVDIFVAAGFEGELRASTEGEPVWVPVAELPAVDMIGFVRVIMPLTLVPDTFLTGTIHHTRTGDVVRYQLYHHRIGDTHVLEQGKFL
jgi:8-oxo-dGTP pyrophosphatase MutT (NUDIX family)